MVGAGSKYMSNHNQDILQKIPSVDAVLKSCRIRQIKRDSTRQVLVAAIRIGIHNIRRNLLAGKISPSDEDSLFVMVLDEVQQEVEKLTSSHYRRAINATGIILHTALGRAVLSVEAMQQIQEELAGYSVLQIDMENGKRASRDARIETLFCLLTGSEAATIVNNNAAATAIVLNTVAKDREVIVSRGQLVEIGGSFRLPDVMAFSGAKLVEVGTTNKTHLRDYENAITGNTAAIMRVHPSNYRIQGFSSDVSLEPLVYLAHKHNLVMIDDIGSGSLIDFSQFGFEREPTLQDSVGKGADIVTSSGDKLLGGPQSGIILGKSGFIQAVRKNQFARIVRVDKFTLAAMEATLKSFFDETEALTKIPTMQMVMKKPETIEKTAEEIICRLDSLTTAEFELQQGFSRMGSGSYPTHEMPTVLLAVKPKKMTAELLARCLRQYSIPIITRIKNDQVLIDPRTLQAGDEQIIVNALKDILQADYET